LVTDRKDSKSDLQVECASHSLRSTDDKLSLIGAWSGDVTHYKILGAPIITGKAEHKLVKLCTQVGYINSMQQSDISPIKT